jgi:hypothetical protein
MKGEGWGMMDLGAPPSPAWLDGFGWDGMRAHMGATLR